MIIIAVLFPFWVSWLRLLFLDIKGVYPGVLFLSVLFVDGFSCCILAETIFFLPYSPIYLFKLGGNDIFFAVSAKLPI